MRSNLGLLQSDRVSACLFVTEGAVAKYCDEYVCVCLCVCVSVCPRGYLRNYACDLYQISCACCLWPWFDPSSGQDGEIPRERGNFGGFIPH